MKQLIENTVEGVWKLIENIFVELKEPSGIINEWGLKLKNQIYDRFGM